MKLKSKTLKSIANKPFRLIECSDRYLIKKVMSGYIVLKDDISHGVLLPWKSTNKKMVIAFNHCGNYVESTIKIKEIIFINP